MDPPPSRDGDVDYCHAACRSDVGKSLRMNVLGIRRHSGKFIGLQPELLQPAIHGAAGQPERLRRRLHAAAVVGLFAAPSAQAQEYPNVSGLTAFTPEANFMSLPGVLRWKHYQATGQWISRDEAVQAARGQGAAV